MPVRNPYRAAVVQTFQDPPFDPDHAPYSGDERAVTLWLLDYHRHVLLHKLDGITNEQGRRTVAPSDLTLLGLARHLGNVEQYWFGHVFLGIVPESEPWRYDDAADPDIDFHPGATDRLSDALDLLHSEIERARQVTALHSFDAIAAGQREGQPVNLRWIIVHLIEEYARHCGHADLIRQSIDGSTGD
jgi:hypothetical protein